MKLINTLLDTQWLPQMVDVREQRFNLTVIWLSLSNMLICPRAEIERYNETIHLTSQKTDQWE